MHQTSSMCAGLCTHYWMHQLEKIVLPTPLIKFSFPSHKRFISCTKQQFSCNHPTQTSLLYLFSTSCPMDPYFMLILINQYWIFLGCFSFRKESACQNITFEIPTTVKKSPYLLMLLGKPSPPFCVRQKRGAFYLMYWCIITYSNVSWQKTK